jgi:hypothetical protein
MQRSNSEWSELIADITVGSPAARAAALATLRREVTEDVESIPRLPVAGLDDTPLARHALARRVLERLEADGFRLLIEWRGRWLRQRDHSSFAAMTRTVLWFVAVQCAPEPSNASS